MVSPGDAEFTACTSSLTSDTTVAPAGGAGSGGQKSIQAGAETPARPRAAPPEADMSSTIPKIETQKVEICDILTH